MKQDKMPPTKIGGWEENRNRNRNRNMTNNDDISRDRFRTFDDEWEKQHTTRPSHDSRHHLPYRDRDRGGTHIDRDRDQSWSQSQSQSQSRSRSRGREWESRSPFYDDRHKSNEYGDNRNSRNHYDDDGGGPGGRRQSNRINKIACKFFAAGKCYRDDCKFSHDIPDSQDYDRRSHDDVRAHKNGPWHDRQPHDDLNASEKNKSSWNGPTWDDVESGGFDENKKTWDSHNSDDKKKSSWGDVANPNLDNKNKSWNVSEIDNENQQRNDSHLNNGDIYEKGQVENGKSPKQEKVKLEEGNIGNDEKCRDTSPNRRERESRSPVYGDRHKLNENVRNNSRGDKLKESWSERPDYSRNSHNKNSRNIYDDDDDDDRNGSRQSNRIGKKQCKFFSVGKCYRDDCKFSHDVQDSRNYDRKSHDDMNMMTWHDRPPHASDLFESKKSWEGPTWCDVESKGFDENKKTTWDFHDDKKSTRDDDVSNPNLDGSHGAKLDTKSKGGEKSQQDNAVNDSHLNNANVPSENLTNAIDYLKSLPDTKGKIGNDENGKSVIKNEKPVVGSEKRQEEEKVDEGNIGNDEKSMRPFRTALVEFVKEVLKPKWKEGRMTREVYKTVVKKVVEKVTSTIHGTHVPTTETKIDQYLTRSKPKIMKLVEAYVEKLVKA
ncbi:hypothetical protein L2E82_22923 [Cichorium intybus]|uniref:Uncharacterized protein n=1 Tax=Cichorium intybus TaxID=13427 RepID=A0ACB9DZ45_CICIN|nr:hypothetical protein L2E82_22923 [Cichorium intybus]